MTNEEKSFYTTYLISTGVSKATISGYLTALRHFELASGVANPTKNSELSKQLMQGHENIQRNPAEAVTKKQRRPVTGLILKLLGHALAKSSKSSYEQSLFWTVALVAFWGSFRIAELLCEFRHSFNSKDSLMVSDIRFESKSASIWLRYGCLSLDFIKT